MNHISQIAIYKNGKLIANVPSPGVNNKPVAVPWPVWKIILFWVDGAGYAPKYKNFTWEWKKA